jgi:flagellar motor switch protein FliM
MLSDTFGLGAGPIETSDFHKDRQLWYYRSLAEVFSKKLPGQLSNELREIVQVLEAGG